MKIQSSLIKCSNCGVFNTDRVHCKNCGAHLKPHQERKQKRTEKFKQDERSQLRFEIENPNFVERLKNHQYFLLRVVGWLLYSVWFVVSMIGAGLAWFIAMVAAG